MDPALSQREHTEPASGRRGSGDAQGPTTAPRLDVAWTDDEPLAAEQAPDRPAGEGRGHLFDRSSREMALVLVAVPLIILVFVIVLLHQPLGL